MVLKYRFVGMCETPCSTLKYPEMTLGFPEANLYIMKYFKIYTLNNTLNMMKSLKIFQGH